MKKVEAIKKCAEVIQRKNVEEWYNKNMFGKPQGDTVPDLIKSVEKQELSLEEALYLALLTGFQWIEKFND